MGLHHVQITAAWPYSHWPSPQPWAKARSATLLYSYRLGSGASLYLTCGRGAICFACRHGRGAVRYQFWVTNGITVLTRARFKSINNRLPIVGVNKSRMLSLTACIIHAGPSPLPQSAMFFRCQKRSCVLQMARNCKVFFIVFVIHILQNHTCTYDSMRITY